MRSRWARRFQMTALLGFAALFPANVARAEEPSFGAFDVQTVFFIDKSDDHNRVDYGMRLDEHCIPAKDAVFPYWREFEHSPPVRTHSLGVFEYVAYGLSEQRLIRQGPASAEYMIKLKQFGRPIFISTHKNAGGSCVALARTTIAGVEWAALLSIYVKLAGVLSVDYVDAKGKNLETGQLIEERLRK